MRLRTLLAELDSIQRVFWLTCNEPVQISRIQSRTNNPERLSWELTRMKELNAIQNAAARRGDIGRKIDTSRLTAHQTAETIWRLVA